MRAILASVVACLFLSTAASARSTAETVQALQEQGRQAGWTFQVGATSMLELSEEVGTGFQRDADWKSQAEFVALPPAALPVRFDWRERGVVGPVRDQALPVYCGSCWAHGTTSAFESAIAIKTGRIPTLSVQQLVSCQPSYGTCSGGYAAFGVYKQVGATYESEFPYTARDVACRANAPHHEKASDWGYIGAEDREPTLTEMKTALYNYGPLVVTISSTPSWRAYTGGIYNACDGYDINHIVTLVGWDDTSRTWIIKNSHGTQWGEQGYMRMKYTNSLGQKCNHFGESAAWVTYEGE